MQEYAESSSLSKHTPASLIFQKIGSTKDKALYYWIVGKFIIKKAQLFFEHLILKKDAYEEDKDKENQILIEAAKSLHIRVVDHGGGMLEFKKGEKRTYIKGNATELESAVSHKIAGDKYLVNKILKEHGLPVPHAVCYRLSHLHCAIQSFRKRNKMVVIKPRRGTTGGTGITAGITTICEFKKAFYEASLFDDYILVEDFIEGKNIRLLMLKDELLSAVERVRPYVTGDGSSTIKELILSLNIYRSSQRTNPKLWPITFTNDLYHTLRRQNLSLKSIPARGQNIFVKTICSGHQGSTVEEVTSLVHRDFIEISRKAMAACKITFSGIDIITPDISRPFSEVGGWINEINSTPSFYGHYQVTNQQDLKFPAVKFFIKVFKLGN